MGVLKVGISSALPVVISQIFGGCWDDIFDFEGCCHVRHELGLVSTRSEEALDAVLDVLLHKRKLRGNPGCWDTGNFTYARCCSVNGAYTAPHYTHPFWMLVTGVRRWPEVIVVQGTTLDAMQDDSGLQFLPHDGRLHFCGVLADGAGILWPTGAALALVLSQMDFSFDISTHHQFLEVAAGTGAPSLVALAKGFTVLSTDLQPETKWQRAASAWASFGPEAELLRHLYLLEVDLLDESTWSELGEVPMDVIALAPPYASGLRLCAAYKRLLRRTLASTGCAFYAPNVGLPPADLEAKAAFFTRDFDIVVHAQLRGWWTSFNHSASSKSLHLRLQPLHATRVVWSLHPRRRHPRQRLSCR